MAWSTPRTWATNDLVTAALLNQEVRDNLNAVYAAIVPSGTLLAYSGSTVPTSGWLLCDGTAVSRTTYANLFAVVGTTYGVGDGSTTFNVPDLRGRFPLGKDNMGGVSANRVTASAADNLGGNSGAETHTLSISEMPSHAHAIYYGTGGATQSLGNAGLGVSNTTTSTGLQGGGGAHNNMPPYIALNYIIKT